ncbi:MAG: DctP family TRAP transporter solute-binding subunit [Synergistaceae bacterium]|jgi:tripartite ATP-independent transporter DctP family solute receptor|nr:DctP family TRAP transporter solute-binding subunit [Synergistaceae bacterium]
MKRQKFFVSALACFVLCVAALPAFAAAEFTIKVGSIVSETHPDMVVMKSTFVPLVEEKSGGRIKVELYPNGQLGGDRELSESVQMGTLQIALPATSVLAGFDKRFQVLDLPFLFTTRETAFEALDGALGEKLNSLLPALGFGCLGYIENGFRHITNSRQPITQPGDLKGVKLRTMENAMHIAFFRQLGANPTPMSFGELYTALQQGTVDGQENPATLIYESKFYEVQKYLSTTGHVFSVVILLSSQSFMDSLPGDLRQIVVDAAAAFVKEHRRLMPESEVENMKVLREMGMAINELTPEQKKPFLEATSPVYAQFEADLTSEIMDLARKAQK